MSGKSDMELFKSVDAQLRELKDRVMCGELRLDEQKSKIVKMLKIKTDELVALCRIAQGK